MIRLHYASKGPMQSETFQGRCELCYKIVTTSRYVVPTGRVKVPAGRLEDLSRAGPTSGIRAWKKTGRYPKGNIMILTPVSGEEHIIVQRETKARTILLQSLPEDHMADFHHPDDARDI
ncbi:hypothetical protein Tco_0971759 [Tanacetum coccineum]